MTVRQFFAPLAAMALLHLSMDGNAARCTGQGAHASLASARPAAHAEHQHHATTPPSDRERTAPCRAPTLPACCVAVASCSVNAARAADSEHASAASGGANLVSAHTSEMPASRTLGPEPPPPRA